jgi:diguanylate cyclase (GGDEF)-like protein/PAS domain S-box-containing protein
MWWLFLAGAVAASALSRLVYQRAPLPAYGPLWIGVHVAQLAMTVLLLLALLGFAGRAGLGAAAAIDATIVVLGAGLLSTVLVTMLYAANQPPYGTFWVTLRAGYVFRDVLILAALIHLATVVRWSASFGLLCLGLLGLLSYDALFRLGQAGPWLSGAPADVGWLLYFAATGAAALLPSMATIEVATDAAERVGASLRLGVVLPAALLPMGAIMLGASRLPPSRQPLLVLVATATLLLVIARVVDTSIRLRRQMDGEHVIQKATADLVQAMDPMRVLDIIETAARRLSPSGTRTATAEPGPAAGDHMPESGSAWRTVGVAELPDTARARLAGHGPVLALKLHQLPPEYLQSHVDNGGGQPALFVQTARPVHTPLRRRLAVLAVLGGQALERVRLNAEITRHVRDDYFRALVQNSADVILIVDDADRIRYASPSATSLFDGDPVVEAYLPDLVSADDRTAASAALRSARGLRHPDEPEPRAWGDWTVGGTGHEPRLVDVLCRDLRTDPSVSGLVVTLHDVTEERRLQRELTRRAYTDALTGLSNRRAFVENLAAVMGDPAASPVVVFFIDIDDLKTVNDRYGHHAGDALLVCLGQRLGSFLDPMASSTMDMAARISGDEFAMMLVSRPDLDVTRTADRLVADLGQPALINHRELPCGVSVGVAISVDAARPSELLRHADHALYAAKRAGKRGWRQYQPHDRGTSRGKPRG